MYVDCSAVIRANKSYTRYLLLVLWQIIARVMQVLREVWRDSENTVAENLKLLPNLVTNEIRLGGKSIHLIPIANEETKKLLPVLVLKNPNNIVTKPSSKNTH